MYTIYYDSGTTNTRAYLIKDGRIAHRLERQIGARNSALAKDKGVLIGALYHMYLSLLEMEGIGEGDVLHVYMSGMISCPSGMVEIEHLPAPVDRETLRAAIVSYDEKDYFKRTIEIIPGIKTFPKGAGATALTAAAVNMMRGEEIEIFGILGKVPGLNQGNSILVLPGSHTQVAFLKDGVIQDISSNITGELFGAITKETILGASVESDLEWEMDASMICLGYENVHTYGFNRALYILRILDLFTEEDVNKRRSYLEGVLNAGVMDAIAGAGGDREAPLAVMGSYIQYQIYKAFCEKLFPQFHVIWVESEDETPFSVRGLLEIL